MGKKAARSALSTASLAEPERLTAQAKPSGSTMKRKPDNTADRSLQEVLNRLPHEKSRCLDVETSGLDWKRNHIVGYVVTFGPAPQDSYYIPFRHLGSNNIGERQGPSAATAWDRKLAPGEAELIKKLDEPGTMMFGHNLAFDLRFLSGVNFTMQPRIEDTMINEPLIDEFVGRYSLEACAYRYKVQAKKSDEIISYIIGKFPGVTPKEAMGHYWRLAGNDKVAVEYARGDGTSTWQLRDSQMQVIRRVDKDTDGVTPMPTLEKVWDVESRLIPVLARMMIKGVKVDEERLEAVIEEIDDTVEKLVNKFPSGFNALSHNDVRAWMEKHNHTDWPHTAKGKPSFIADWLQRYDAGKEIIRVRKFNNIKSSFINPLKERHLFKGRVHCQFNQLRSDEFGTVTGRLSSSDPNMQQVPKHDEELGRLFRSAFVPDYDLWGDRDYSQIEPRLMAYYTRSEVFLNDYRTNPKADAHTAVAQAANRNWDKLSKAEQKHYRNNFGKRINQTVITGGGRGVLVQKYKVPENEVDDMLKLYHRALPELKPFQKQAARRYRMRGYVLSLLHRRARLEDPDRDYTALNRLLQCGNADIIKLKMVEVDEFLENERVGGKRPNVDILLNCHDALSFQFDEAARPVYDRCKVIMEDFSSDAALIKLDLPIIVDEGEGSNWEIATYGKKDIELPVPDGPRNRGRKNKLISVSKERIRV